MLKNFAHRLLSVSLVNVTTSNKFSNDSLISPNTKPMFKRSSCLKKIYIYVYILIYIYMYIYLKILLIYFYFLEYFIYLLLERGEGREKRGRETSVCERYQLLLTRPPTSDQAFNPDMCPDWELNQQTFSSQASTQSTKPHQPGLKIYFWFRVQTRSAYSIWI